MPELEPKLMATLNCRPIGAVRVAGSHPEALEGPPYKRQQTGP